MAKVEETQKEFESFADEEPIAPVSVNKYDPFQLKAGMDECIVALLEEKKFIEDNRLMDIKLVIYAMQIGITAFSQLYKPDESWHFLNNKPMQMGFVALYGLLVVVFYYVDTYMIGECFFECTSHPVSRLILLTSASDKMHEQV